MKNIIIILFSIISICAKAQTPINTTQARFLNNTDSTGKGSTTGIIRYDPATGKFRFWNALTSTWSTYGIGSVVNVTGTSPISISGTTTKNISMTAAGAATSGYVTSAAQTFGGVKTFASPVFTGIPIAPTASAGTNTTQIATTAFVQTSSPTASNGITKTANNFTLGDITMTADVNLMPLVNNTTSLNIGWDGLDNAAAGLTVGSYNTNLIGITQVALQSGTGSAITINGNNITLNSSTFKALADYSGSYTARSYVDKAYADTKIDGTMVSTRVPIGSDANTLTTDASFTYDAGATALTVPVVLSSQVTSSGSLSLRSTSGSVAISSLGGVGNISLTTFGTGNISVTNSLPNDDALTNVVVRDPATGFLKYRSASSISGTFSGSLAATQIAYGTGANTIGSEAAFTYNSGTDLLTATNGMLGQNSLTAGSITLGDGTTSGSQILVNGSGPNNPLSIKAEGGSDVSIYSGSNTIMVDNDDGTTSRALYFAPFVTASGNSEIASLKLSSIAKKSFDIRSGDGFTSATQNIASGDDIRILAGNGSTTNGLGGDITIKAGTGSGSGRNGFIIMTGLPTSCAGAPTGALWNNAGVLSICP